MSRYIDALRYVLNFAVGGHRLPTEDSPQNRDRIVSSMLPIATADKHFMLPNWATSSEHERALKRTDAWFEVHDQARLAALMREIALERGVVVTVFDYEDNDDVKRISLTIHDQRGRSRIFHLDMPTARAVVLRWLDITQGDVEPAIEVARQATHGQRLGGKELA